MLFAAAATLLGFIILIWSADLFVAGAASIAENMGLSQIMIGLTIVSIGTSAPEILVSITAALSGVGELAIGNAIGSNIANIGLVLGITVLIAPLCINRATIRKELPVLLLVTFGCGALLLDGELSRFDGLLMLGALAVVLYLMWRFQDQVSELLGDENPAHLSPLRAWLSFTAGLLLLVASSRLLVWGASEIALFLGVSQLLIGLTVVAIGTSLPELAATLASALRGHSDIAVGNILGSNLFNLLAVMAIPGLFETEQLDSQLLPRDYSTMTAMTLLLALALYLGRGSKQVVAGQSYVGRSAGILFVSIYALYYYWLYQTR